MGTATSLPPPPSQVFSRAPAALPDRLWPVRIDHSILKARRKKCGTCIRASPRALIPARKFPGRGGRREERCATPTRLQEPEGKRGRKRAAERGLWDSVNGTGTAPLVGLLSLKGGTSSLSAVRELMNVSLCCVAEARFLLRGHFRKYCVAILLQCIPAWHRACAVSLGKRWRPAFFIKICRNTGHDCAKPAVTVLTGAT